MAHQVIIIGSYVQDHCWNTDAFPAVGESRIGTFSTGAGGKGFNQAIACHRQSVSSCFIGAIGCDALGATAKQFAEQNQLAARWEEHSGVSTAASSIVVNARGDNLICVALGANDCLSPEFIQCHQNTICEAEIIIAQLENNLAATRAAFVLAQQHGLTRILNPAPINPKVDLSLIQMADILTPNETEFAFLIEHLFGDHHAAAAAKQSAQLDDVILHALCQRFGLPTVVVTLGEHGCFVSHRKDQIEVDDKLFYRVRSESVKVRDTTGAGDAFSGGLAAGMIIHHGKAFAHAVRHANRVAALSTERAGTAPAMPTQQELIARFQH